MKKNLYSFLSLAVFILIAGSTSQAQTAIYWEEFDGSANGWENDIITPLDSSLGVWVDNKWNWSPDGDVSNGLACCGSNPNAIQSETAANGSMVFNGDFYTTNGVNNPGPNPDLYNKYICHLVSPTIDLSGTTSLLDLKFDNYFRYLNPSPGAPGGFRYSVSWSTDDGQTWSDPVNAAEGHALHEYTMKTTTIPLPNDLAGTSTFKVRFTFSADFYFWVIDDIQIIDRPSHDMRANTNWYAIATNAMVPASQVEAFGFMCDIQNMGNQAQTGVNLNINIVDDATGNSVYSADQAYGTIGVDSIAENVVFGDFTPPDVPGTYRGTYTVSADSTDFNPDNNTIEFTFMVTDTVFAKEFGATTSIYPNASNWNAGEPRSWTYGNYYYVPNGDGWYANSATFSFSPGANFPADDKSVQITLYEWNDNNGDTLAQFGERTVIGTYIHTIQGNETATDLLTVPLTNIATGLTPELKNNTNYLLMIEYNAEGEEELRIGASNVPDFAATNFASVLWGAPRFSSFFGAVPSLDGEDYNRSGGFVAVARLNIGETPLFSSTKERLNPAEIVKISPNPANAFVQFDVNLRETSSQIRLELIDLTGKTLSVQEFQQLKEFNTTFNTANLPNGTYFVRISTDFGFATQRFVVQQ
jgi:hypothetical protein